MYRPEDLNATDVQDYVRREQSRFFRGGSYDPLEAASKIALEALLLGAHDVRITRDGDWISVSSESDWLSGAEEAAFRGLSPIRGIGRNEVMSEVLLTVFARGVATAKNGKSAIVKGNSLGPLSLGVPVKGRVVTFRIDSE